MYGSVKAAPKLNLFCRLMCLALITALFIPAVQATDETFISARQPERIELLVGKSIIIHSSRLINRINIPNEEVAKATVGRK